MIEIPIEVDSLCSKANQFNQAFKNVYIEGSFNTSNNTIYENSIQEQIENKFKCIKEPKSIDQTKMVKHFILAYAYPVISILGIISNIISFIIMLRLYKRKKNTYRFSIILAALSLADLAVLIFGCLREFTDHMLEWKLSSINIYFCKIIYFNCYLFSCFSAYLHAFISLERWNAISNPIKSKIYQLKNKLYLIYIFLMCVVISSPFTYFAKIKNFISYNKKETFEIQVLSECVLSENFYLFEIVMTSIDFIFYYLIPFIITFIFSLISTICMYKENTMKTNEVNCKRDIESKSKENFEIVTMISNSDKNNSSTFRSSRTSTNMVILNLKTISNLKITTILMIIPICYLITTLPTFIIILLQLHSIFYQTNIDFDYQSLMDIAKTLMYLNNSINVFFYVLLGKSLRKELLEIFLVCFKKKSQPWVLN